MGTFEAKRYGLKRHLIRESVVSLLKAIDIGMSYLEELDIVIETLSSADFGYYRWELNQALYKQQYQKEHRV